MTYPVASLTLDSARSYVMQGASFTQGTISSIPIGGSISPEGFVSSIMLLVVIIVTVVIVVVILVVVVAIVGVVIVVALIEEVIEFGDSYKAPPKEAAKDKGPAGEVSSSIKKKGRTVAITAEDT
nr:hypothetical protein [Tanacetum cinerariifolium]